MILISIDLIYRPIFSRLQYIILHFCSFTLTFKLDVVKTKPSSAFVIHSVLFRLNKSTVYKVLTDSKERTLLHERRFDFVSERFNNLLNFGQPTNTDREMLSLVLLSEPYKFRITKCIKVTTYLRFSLRFSALTSFSNLPNTSLTDTCFALLSFI